VLVGSVAVGYSSSCMFCTTSLLSCAKISVYRAFSVNTLSQSQERPVLTCANLPQTRS
jgi:hypothetical protein